MFFRIILLTASVIFLFGCSKNKGTANIEPPPTDTVEITSAVLTDNLLYPWEILWGPDNFIWMTERGGDISRVDPATGTKYPLLHITEVYSFSASGLLGMTLHPDFVNHPYVYVAYTYKPNGKFLEKVVRFTFNGTTLVDPFVLVDNVAAGITHDGSRLVISPDLKLFITLGDGFQDSTTAQNKNLLNGKILRINLDGTIPADNPVPGSPIWTSGHRNPQGLVLVGNILYSSEHGPTTDDEINIIEKGRNYGWPNVKGYCDTATEQGFCDSNQVRQPIKTWSPTVAPSGLDYYGSDSIPQWKNSLLLCTLKNNTLWQLKLNDEGTEVIMAKTYFSYKYGRLRDLCISPDGKVYVCTSTGNNDKIFVIHKQ